MCNVHGPWGLIPFSASAPAPVNTLACGRGTIITPPFRLPRLCVASAADMFSAAGVVARRKGLPCAALAEIAGEPMLVLSRKAGERILIGDQISVTVVRIAPGVVRIGIQAPDNLPIVREELKTGQPVGEAPDRPVAVSHTAEIQPERQRPAP